MVKRRSKATAAAGNGEPPANSIVEEPHDVAGPAPRGPGSYADGRAIIRRHLKTMPKRPGVYRMIDRHGDVLYVGKAKNLRNRVTSYTNIGSLSTRIARMVARTRDMVVVTTHTEAEALLLEANLIKRFRPPYNVIMRDDKSFPYILIKREHEWAQIAKHRGARSFQGDYFGPFASAGAVNRTLNTLQKAFLLRSCSDSVFESRTRPCLLFQIKRCSAPCVGRITTQDYAKLVSDAADFLKGKSHAIQQSMSARMLEASENFDYETAAVYRDRIRALTQIQAHQGINVSSVDEADVIAAHQEAGQTCIQVFFFRAGQNWGNRPYFPRHDKDEPLPAIMSAFISQFYDNKPSPALVLVGSEVDEKGLLEEALTVQAGKRVQIVRPQRGEKRELIEHAERNAREALGRRLAENASERKLLDSVASVFDMDAAPARIEVYDNSHISGDKAVGGMIVASMEGLTPSAYRKFNIKSSELAPGDDYGMLREVLTRRFSRLLKDDPERARGQWPDLVLIDGGAGQLSAALDVFADLGVEDVTLAGIAKGPDRNAGRETFYMPERQPFGLEPHNPVLYYLQRLRDEAHRYAIGSHRARRSSDIRKSPLDEVPGVGARRKRALLNHFGSARAVTEAGLTDLEAVEGVSKTLAKTIYGYFHEGA
jgi:excinuclease ABC subunit C